MDTCTAIAFTAVIFTAGFILFPDVCSWFVLMCDGEDDG